MSRNIAPIIADSLKLGLANANRLRVGITPENFSTFAKPGGETVVANHPSFIFGHLAIYPSRIVSQLGQDASSITADAEFDALYNQKATCQDDPDGSIYPSMEVVMDLFERTHAAALQAIEAADDEQFVQPNPNEAMRATFGTMGSMHAFYVGGHIMLHMGQLSTWRRAMGMAPA
ncbi:MAG: DinB family protein [Planctomycetota bacterium]